MAEVIFAVKAVVPDGKEQAILEAVTDHLGWSELVGSSRKAFLEKQLLIYLKGVYQAYVIAQKKQELDDFIEGIENEIQ